MAQGGRRDPVEPMYKKLKDTSRRGEDMDLSRLSADQLKDICGAHGLSQSGTKKSMKADIEFYLDMSWGVETEKVSVAVLRCVQGPRAVFRRKDRIPEAFFNKLFTTEMWDHILTETNRYDSERVRETMTANCPN